MSSSLIVAMNRLNKSL